MAIEKLAPIILFTYNRPEHTQKVLNALADNKLAKDSNLYIFCDGPKNEGAVEKNRQTQAVIIEEAGRNRFHQVHLTISEVNKGLANSIITGVTDVLRQHGSCIVLEDDHITSRYFLTYMNDCVRFYENDQRIWSISGFTYHLKALDTYSHDVYMSYRANSHGWATWLDRWETVDWNVTDFSELSKSPARIMHFNRGGNDLYRMLRHQMRGERDSWAIRFCYAQSKQDKLAVYPRVSLISNIGFDGSGTHCQEETGERQSAFMEDLDKLTLEHLDVDPRVARDFKNQYRVTIPEAIDWVAKKLRTNGR